MLTAAETKHNSQEAKKNIRERDKAESDSLKNDPNIQRIWNSDKEKFLQLIEEKMTEEVNNGRSDVYIYYDKIENDIIPQLDGENHLTGKQYAKLCVEELRELDYEVSLEKDYFTIEW